MIGTEDFLSRRPRRAVGREQRRGIDLKTARRILRDIGRGDHAADKNIRAATATDQQAAAFPRPGLRRLYVDIGAQRWRKDKAAHRPPSALIS